MYKALSGFCCAILLPFLSISQVIPKEDATLNYRIVGIKFPPKTNCKYIIEIAHGKQFSDDSFDKQVIITQASTSNKVIAEVPSFGRDYTWRASFVDASKKITRGELHHFSTAYFKGIDTAINRLRIIDSAIKYKGAYVFIEANRALYDMGGNPVWFLPTIDGFNIEFSHAADLQLSNNGTITFLYENNAAYEVDYNGKILFKTPMKGSLNGDSLEHFHHEFRRLDNGNYMVLGSEIARWGRSFPTLNDSNTLILPTDKKKTDPATPLKEVPFGTLIEYDKNGNVVWYWRSSEYFVKSDIFNHIGKRNTTDISVHANSFYFDEKSKMIYMSFRDISRILKVKYPEGRVVAAYGEVFKPGVPEAGNGLFCRQHSCKISSGGNLYLYNNNACDPTGFPSVVMMSMKTNKNGGLKKVWEYTCPIEGQTGKTQTAYNFVHGGNVVELPDHSIFTSMSTLYSRVFIVSPEKNLLWSAIPERWDNDLKKWSLVIQYKASLINSRKDLEKLIWNQEED